MTTTYSSLKLQIPPAIFQLIKKMQLLVQESLENMLELRRQRREDREKERVINSIFTHLPRYLQLLTLI